MNRIKLAHLPTAVEPLPRLSEFLSGPRLIVKRDDQTGLAFGGNKTRKLEYILQDALERGADTLVTGGAVQSNHCRQTAAAAARMGLRCVLVLSGDPAEAPSGNLLLDRLFDARIVYTTRAERETAMGAACREVEGSGGRPYLIPIGGSNALGASAYAHALGELLEQGVSPDWIVFASSSGGTQAGLVAGAHLSGYPGQLLGISVDEPEEVLTALVAQIAGETAALLGSPRAFSPEEIRVNADYLGEGYGIMGPREREAIGLFARYEGVLLDPVYTGRAAAGLVDLIRKGRFGKGETVLFWHTGGTPALLAEKYRGVLE